MSRIGLTVLTVLLAGLVAHAEEKESKAKDVENLQGKWLFVSLEVNGLKVPESFTKNSSITISGEEFVSKDARSASKGKFVLGVGKDPKTIELQFLDGSQKGNSAYGIYKFDGERLVICMSLAGETPTEFSAKAGSSRALEVLKKVKEEEK